MPAAWNARQAAALFTLFAGYVSTALFGLQINAVSGFATLVWPPTGIAIAFVVLFGRGMWPAVLLAAFVANLVNGGSAPIAFAIAVGNTLEAIVASWLFERRGFRPELDRVRDVLTLVVFGALLSTLVSATVGVAALRLGGVIANAAIASTWTAWWIGDALGAIVMAPLLFTLARSRKAIPPARRVEGAFLALLVVAFNAAVFLGGPSEVAVASLLQPILIWIALRFGLRETAAAVFVTSAFAIWGTVTGHGPFVGGASVSQDLLYLQLFVGSLAVTHLTLAVAVAERALARDDADALNAQLETRVREQTVAIQESKEKTDAVLESIGEGVIAVDRDAKITLVNGAAERMLAVSRADAIGRKYETLFSMRDAKGLPVWPRPMRVSLETGKSVVTNANDPDFYVRKDGTRFPVAITTTPVFLGEESIGVVQTFRDVTEEQKVERAKTEFVELASHQLRALLTAIRWNVDLLSEEGRVDSARRKGNLGEIRAAADRMGEVIDALLNVSKADLGLFPIVPVSVDLAKLAKSVEDELALPIAQKRLAVAVKAKGTVKSDANLLRIILQNLLSNSVKYSTVEGRIKVSVEHARGRVRISVADHGIGIPKSERGRIFTKFFRTDEARRADPEGNGLGLYLVKSILEQIGGRIWFERNTPKGTVFHAELPEPLAPKRRTQKPQARPVKKTHS
jgi:PAS domain S-box-containing protein